MCVCDSDVLPYMSMCTPHTLMQAGMMDAQPCGRLHAQCTHGANQGQLLQVRLAHIPPLPQPRAQILTVAWHETHMHPSTSVSSPGSGV